MFNWLKKKVSLPDKEAPVTMELFELMAELLAQVVSKDREALFSGAIIQARKGIVYISKLNITIRCEVRGEQQHNEAIVYYLAFFISIHGEEIFYEELAGVGVDPIAAIENGVASFNMGFLEGVLQSLQGCYEPDFPLHDIADNKFHLVYTPLQVQGAFREDRSLDHAGFVRILVPLINDRLHELAEQGGDSWKDYYWIKIYMSGHPDGQFIGECRFNHEEWDTGLAALLEQDFQKWDKADAFRGKKQFIFIRRCALSS